jgi:tRNA modification GTPase
MFDADTIAAISTPAGEGGIGIVRLSGADAVKIAGGMFFSRKGKTLAGLKSHRILHGFIIEPETDETIDEVIVSVMKAPGTYTREDVVEINCHGGMTPLRRILELALKRGARLAGPGEFTKRAFLNGRIDLSQAEAVLDIIRAKTDASEKAAMEQLRGGISEKINRLREALVSVCAHVEACIDFPEDDIELQSMSDIKKTIEDAASELKALSESYEEGRYLREGLKVAIVGKPNVGKSSILNALLKKDRAIVTESPGTTRDVLEECINIKGLPVVVMDTAGIRQAHEMAEKEGVRRSLMAIKDADLALAVFDGSLPLKEEDMEVLNRLEGKNAVLVFNKKDLPSFEVKVIKGYPVAGISAKTGEGLDKLKDLIFGSSVKAGGFGEGAPVTNLRHKVLIDGASDALERALRIIKENQPIEILSFELRDALDKIGSIVGAVTTEDILERIFSDFCIGK